MISLILSINTDSINTDSIDILIVSDIFGKYQNITTPIYKIFCGGSQTLLQKMGRTKCKYKKLYIRYIEIDLMEKFQGRPEPDSYVYSRLQIQRLPERYVVCMYVDLVHF